MSDTFTIQGGVGTPVEVDAEMLQGIGFPLRGITSPLSYTPFNLVSSDTTITEPTGGFDVDASSGDVTITLPTLVAGYSYTIRKANRTGGDVIISGTINGNATTTLTGAQNPSVNIKGFTTEWGLV